MAKKKHKPGPLGKALTRYRKQRNLTMRQLSQAVGVTESYISFIESGMRSPSRKLIKKLVSFFYPQGNPHLHDEWLMMAGFAPVHMPETVPKSQPFEHFEDSLNQQPDNLRTWFAYIRAQIKLGYHQQAETQIQEAFQRIQDAVAIQSLLGTLELARGHYDNAVLAQETALRFFKEAAPTSPQRLTQTDLLLSLGVSYFLKGLDTAVQSHRAQSQKKPYKKLTNKAYASFENALATYKQALEIDPEDIYIWDEYARVLFNLADLAPAKDKHKLWRQTLEAYERVLEHPDNGLIGADALLEAALFLGYAHTKSGNYIQGRKVLLLLQAMRPDFALGHYARACHISLWAAYDKDANSLDLALHFLNKAFGLDASGQLKLQAQSDPDLSHLRQSCSEDFEALVKS